jgi:hypothetical protein
MTKAMDSSTSGFVGAHASREVFCDLLVEMEAQLGVQIGVGPGAAESGKLCPKFLEPAHKSFVAWVLGF